jgi:hypothetical protein
MALGVCLACGPALAACPEVEAPRVTVRAVAEPARTDVSKSRAQLAGKGGDNIRTAEVKAAGAVVVPNWNVRSDVKLHYSDSTKSGEGCIGYSDVTVEVVVRPVIFIARERSAPGACRDAVMAHENKHVRAFAASAQDWAKALRGPVTAHVHGAGLQGPVPEKFRVVFEKKLRGDIRTIVEAHTDTMMAQAVSAQAQADSPVAFTAIRKACGGAP